MKILIGLFLITIMTSCASHRKCEDKDANCEVNKYEERMYMLEPTGPWNR